MVMVKRKGEPTGEYSSVDLSSLCCDSLRELKYHLEIWRTDLEFSVDLGEGRINMDLKFCPFCGKELVVEEIIV